MPSLDLREAGDGPLVTALLPVAPDTPEALPYAKDSLIEGEPFGPPPSATMAPEPSLAAI